MYVQRCNQQWFVDNGFHIEQNTIKSVDIKMTYPNEAAIIIVFSSSLAGNGKKGDCKIGLQCRPKELGGLVAQVLECVIGEPYQMKLSDIKNHSCTMIYNANNAPIGIGSVESDNAFFVWGNNSTQLTEV